MERIRLHEKEIYDGASTVTLELMIHQSSPEITVGRRPAMIVFPGGGYAFCSDREAEPVAAGYFSEGYNCFILRYICGEKAKKFNPLYDAAAAIAHVRSHAKEYCVDPDKIAVVGFSAGGHLAGFIATQWHIKDVADKLGIDNELCKPNAAVLGYPVISCNVKTHLGSFDNLIGKDRTEEDMKRANLDDLVDEKTCPCFIWHTATDDCVPVANSLVFANALTKKGIRCELHIFPEGGHGLSRADAETTPDWDAEQRYNLPYVARWMHWSVLWLEETFYGGKTRYKVID